MKLKEYSKKANPNDRPAIDRFSVSLPIELARVVRGLKLEMDLEWSKIFRKGLELIVESAHNKGDISKETYDRFWEVRKGFRDDDMN